MPCLDPLFKKASLGGEDCRQGFVVVGQLISALLREHRYFLAADKSHLVTLGGMQATPPLRPQIPGTIN